VPGKIKSIAQDEEGGRRKKYTTHKQKKSLGRTQKGSNLKKERRDHVAGPCGRINVEGTKNEGTGESKRLKSKTSARLRKTLKTVQRVHVVYAGLELRRERPRKKGLKNSSE